LPGTYFRGSQFGCLFLIHPSVSLLRQRHPIIRKEEETERDTCNT